MNPSQHTAANETQELHPRKLDTIRSPSAQFTLLSSQMSELFYHFIMLTCNHGTHLPIFFFFITINFGLYVNFAKLLLKMLGNILLSFLESLSLTHLHDCLLHANMYNHVLIDEIESLMFFPKEKCTILKYLGLYK